MLRAYFGHHKAASSWITLILGDVAACLDLRSLTIHSNAGWRDHPSLGEKVRIEQPDLLLLTNARSVDVATLPSFRGFHVIRDPRDIVVSGYFSHMHSHPEEGWPELPPHRRTLRTLSKAAGLHAEIEFSGRFIDHIATWHYDRTDTLELRMEDVTASPLHHWRMILRHLNLLSSAENRPTDEHDSVTHARQVSDDWLQVTLEHRSFTNLADGRILGEEDPTHHYRRGQPGDWRSHFQIAHYHAFTRRYGDLAVRLGYDT